MRGIISRDQATRIAAVAFEDVRRRSAVADLMLTRVTECSVGWLFAYDSAKHVRSGEFEDMVPEAAPLLVDRFHGAVHETGTIHPIEHYVAEYEAYFADQLAA